MKHLKLLRICALIAVSIPFGTRVHAQIAISPGPAPIAPNKLAMLDVSDQTRGFLAPRVTFANRPTGPANSLLIYQTDSVGLSGVPQPRGYYYWDGPPVNQWVHVSMGPGWRLGGNAGTNPATNFIGTTNNVAMIMRTNGVQRVQLNTTGQVQLGTLGPANELLEVNGAMRVYTTNVPSSDATPVEGAIRYNNTTGAHEGFVNNPLGGGQIQYVGWYQLENAFKTRVKQRYASVPVVACVYPPPGTVPNGANAGSWLEIDVNGAGANPTTAATTETPYSTFWEDGRHQYLYLSADLQALGVCPNTDIRGIAFRTSSAGTAMGMRNVKVRMKNESTGTLNTFITAGLVDCGSYAPSPSPGLVVVNGWNAHQFNVSNWQWLGIGNNMLVEYCFDNQDWTSNTPVYYEATAYNAMYGLYCDACGSTTFGGSTCYYQPGPCNGTPNTSNAGWNPPTGTSSTASGTICTGWGWGGLAGGGCAWTTATSLTTCDGTFQYQGTHSSAARRPLLRFDAQTSGTAISYLNSSYLLAQNEGVMIGDYASWANSGIYGANNCAAYQFKGPGTIAARSSVYGGTVLLSDHVFDNYYDGKIKPEDAQQSIGYRHYPLREMTNYVERERHLPTIAGREEWNKEGMFSLDQLTNQLWVTVETQSLYIKELNDRMNALQDYLVERRLKELKSK